MNCPANCRCGKHNRHDPRQNKALRNFERWEHGYREQQAERVRRTAATRRAQSINWWSDRPSEHFDYDEAIAGLYGVFDRVYGPSWRKEGAQCCPPSVIGESQVLADLVDEAVHR